MLFSYWRISLPSCLFPSGFPTKTLYGFLFLSVHITCPTLFILELITLITLHEECKLWRLLFCTEHCVQFSYLRTRYVSCSSHTPWYDLRNHICRKIVIVKHLSMQFCTFCRYIWATASLSSPFSSAPHSDILSFVVLFLENERKFHCRTKHIKCSISRYTCSLTVLTLSTTKGHHFELYCLSATGGSIWDYDYCWLKTTRFPVTCGTLRCNKKNVRYKQNL
jgi:hypothetical protein